MMFICGVKLYFFTGTIWIMWLRNSKTHQGQLIINLLSGFIESVYVFMLHMNYDNLFIKCFQLHMYAALGWERCVVVVKKFATSIVDLLFTGDSCVRAGERRILHDGYTTWDDRITRCRCCESTFMMIFVAGSCELTLMVVCNYMTSTDYIQYRHMWSNRSTLLSRTELFSDNKSWHIS